MITTSPYSFAKFVDPAMDRKRSKYLTEHNDKLHALTFPDSIGDIRELFEDSTSIDACAWKDQKVTDRVRNARRRKVAWDRFFSSTGKSRRYKGLTSIDDE